MRVFRLSGALAGLALLACDQSRPLAPLSSADPRVRRSVNLEQDDDGLGSAQGSWQADISGLIATYALDAEVEQNGKGDGEFTFYADEGGGLIVDFDAKVTCLSIDPVNHRAWIGGKVKANRSTDPDLMTKIHRPGHDIWFRVLDDAAGDRSTFVGFEGAAGFSTSADYCAGQPWPADNARTWPVVQGGLTLQP